MGIKLLTTRKQIEGKITKALQRKEEKYIQKLTEAGNILVTEAIRSGDYQDQTGRLRRSIGFVVMKDGVLVSEYFQGGATAYEAKEKAINGANQHQGIVLAVIAGENYASYVESKGYNVLTTARQIASKLIPKVLK